MHVDVWIIDLSEAAFEAAARGVLDGGEHARADRFVEAPHRRRFVLARAAIRLLLGARLNLPAAAVRLQKTAHGKPVLDPADKIGFNLSHSGDTAVFAVGPPVMLGVDIEALAPMPEGVAQRFFAPAETAALLALAGAARDEAFTRLWTRKEAVLKAIGAGLHAPLDGFEAPIAAARKVRLTKCAMQPDLVERLQLLDCPVPDGFCATLAIDAGAASVRLNVSRLASLAHLLAAQ
ncbi:MAG: 4'-phosphopantetheinyl transferase family protein [Caulobacterales bacterium]|jgi:4'-phosphopantetheinyl transferase